MKNTLKSESSGLWPVALLAAAGLLLAMPFTALAQTEEVVELEAVPVTGSWIPLTAGEAPVAPVTVVNTEDITKSGVATSVLEVIRKTVPQFVGNANLGMSNANISSSSTGGGANIALRNTTTLILINGRRAAFSPISGSGGYQYVDVNQIPISAIDRIEVLKDGASAIYGTDATGGVVNIILKKDFQGMEIGGRYDFSDQDGSWEQRRAYATIGTSTADKKTNITVTAEWSLADPLYQRERGFSNPAYGTPTFAGMINSGTSYYLLKPGLNAPPAGDKTIAELLAADIYIGPFSAGEIASNTGAAEGYGFNLADAVTVLLRNDKRIGVVAFDHAINDNMTLFGDLFYSRTMTQSQLNAQPVGTDSRFNTPADHPYNPTDVNVRSRNRFTSDPRVYKYDTSSVRMVGGLKGKIVEDWNYEAAVMWNEVDQNYKNPGVLDANKLLAAAGLNPAAAPGSSPIINLFARQQAPGAIQAAGFIGTAIADFVSTLSTADFKVTGSLFDLPGGKVQIAAGSELRYEKLTGSADLNSTPDADGNLGWAGATSVQPFNQKRDIFAVFTEVLVPILGPDQDIPGAHKLDVTLAGRYERYSDTDDPKVPKVALRWEPIKDELTFRATYGESFNAPTLYSMFGPVDVGFTSPLVVNPVGGGDPLELGQGSQRGGSNPNLKPAESKSYNFGLIYSPKVLDGFSIELDYFRIKESNLVGGYDVNIMVNDVEKLGPASQYSQYVRLNSFDGPQVTAPGTFSDPTFDVDNLYVTSRNQNIAEQELDGIDAVAKYAFLSDWGKFDANVTFTWFNSYEVQNIPGLPAEETAGRASNTNGTIPEWRTYTTLGYQYKGIGVVLGHTYIPSMPYESSPGPEMEAYSTFDLSFSTRFDEWVKMLSGLTIRVGVNNMFNEMPPLAPELYTESNADIDTYSPLGRVFFIEASYQF